MIVWPRFRKIPISTAPHWSGCGGSPKAVRLEGMHWLPLILTMKSEQSERKLEVPEKPEYAWIRSCVRNWVDMTSVGTTLMMELLVAFHLGYILDTSHHMRFCTPSLKGRVGLLVI